MKILPVINNERNHVLNASARMKEIGKTGYRIGSRTANIYGASKFQKYCGITRCVGDKLIKNITKDDLPYISAALGLLVPLPLVSPIAMVVGYILKYILPSSSDSKNNKRNIS